MIRKIYHELAYIEMVGSYISLNHFHSLNTENRKTYSVNLIDLFKTTPSTGVRLFLITRFIECKKTYHIMRNNHLDSHNQCNT